MQMVEIGGAQVRLAFDLQAWFEVEDAFGSMDNLRERLTEDKRPVQACMALLAIEANAGARAVGEETKHTVEEMLAKVKPWQVAELTGAAYDTLAEGMRREENDAHEDVDVVAEELAKKDRADA